MADDAGVSTRSNTEAAQPSRRNRRGASKAGAATLRVFLRVFVRGGRGVVWVASRRPFNPFVKRTGNVIQEAARFSNHPVQLGALMCFLFAIGLAVQWAVLGYALEGEVRPSPVEMAELSSEHRAIFLWTGVWWFALHIAAIWIVIGVFLVHADRQRPTLWVFTVLVSLAILCWALFGAMSIPLGASTGPQYGDAMKRANLSDEQHRLWTTKCEATQSVADRTGIPLAELETSCASAADLPLLLMNAPARATLSETQRLQLEGAWTAAQDTWLVRKLSDTLYFGGNGLFLLSLFFFAGFALSSRVIRTFSVTWACLLGLAYLVGLTAFWSKWGEWANIAAIGLQTFFIVFIGTDIWGRREDFKFSQGAVDTRPVRLLRREIPVKGNQIEWTFAQEDLWYRNRQITNTYARLAYQLGIVTHNLPGPESGKDFPRNADFENGNWFHFGVWASNSAGKRIWRADLSSGMNTSLERAYREVLHLNEGRKRLSEALAEGNRLVFAHVAAIGQTFVQHFEHLDAPDQTAWDAFVGEISAWSEPWQPERAVREALLPAFEAYYRARFSPPAIRTELILFGNLTLVAYEQEALDGVIRKASGNGLRLFVVFIFPSSMIRTLTWGAALTASPFRRFEARLRKRPYKPVTVYGAEWEERWLKRGARGIYGFLNWLFDKEIAELETNQIVLTIGTGERASSIVVGRDLPETPQDWNANASPGGEADKLLHNLLGEETRPICVLDYTDRSDRLRFIAELFRRWQRSPLLRMEPFSSRQRADERMIAVSSIEPNFDSGLRAPPIDSRGNHRAPSGSANPAEAPRQETPLPALAGDGHARQR